MLWDNPRKVRGFCGGTLVASQYVITAAHCTYEDSEYSNRIQKKFEPRDILVSVGDHNVRLSGDTVLEKFMQVESIFRHPDFKQKLGDFSAITKGNDIAILKLMTKLPLGNQGMTYTPACLPKETDNTIFDGKKITVAGWGLISESPKFYPWVPHEVEVTVASYSSWAGESLPSMLWTVKHQEPNKGSCTVCLYL